MGLLFELSVHLFSKAVFGLGTSSIELLKWLGASEKWMHP